MINAATSGRIDQLKGLKENVIIGHKIPVGTGAPGFELDLPPMEDDEEAEESWEKDYQGMERDIVNEFQHETSFASFTDDDEIDVEAEELNVESENDSEA